MLIAFAILGSVLACFVVAFVLTFRVNERNKRNTRNFVKQEYGKAKVKKD